MLFSPIITPLSHEGLEAWLRVHGRLYLNIHSQLCSRLCILGHASLTVLVCTCRRLKLSEKPDTKLLNGDTVSNNWWRCPKLLSCFHSFHILETFLFRLKIFHSSYHSSQILRIAFCASFISFIIHIFYSYFLSLISFIIHILSFIPLPHLEDWLVEQLCQDWSPEDEESNNPLKVDNFKRNEKTNQCLKKT